MIDDIKDLVQILATALIAFAIIGGVIAIPIVWWYHAHPDTAFDKCMESGRAWAVVGTHEVTTYIKTGAVMSRKWKYRCPSCNRVVRDQADSPEDTP